MNEPTALQQAEAELNAARDKYLSFRDEENIARKNTTSALNRLNEAQKAFDAVINALRKDAPQDSDWKRLTDGRRGFATPIHEGC